jgi:cell wall-associated NlpC family hydrolase
MKWLSIILSATTAISAPAGVAVATNEDRTQTVQVAAIKNDTLTDTKTLLLGKSVSGTLIQRINTAVKQQLDEQAAEASRLARNTLKLHRTISKLKRTVGKTWYVFSGDTPSGWDCSGLVAWTYAELGIEVQHSANEQAHSGKRVTSPEPGDIVVFSRDGGNTFYHSAIYIGDGEIVQALRPGTATRIDSISSRLFKGDTIKFVRVTRQNPSA